MNVTFHGPLALLLEFDLSQQMEHRVNIIIASAKVSSTRGLQFYHHR